MSANNHTELEEKHFDSKSESGGSNYDKLPDDNPNHGKTTFKDCLVDLFKNHIFWAIPIACFFGFALGVMSFLFDIDNEIGRIKEMPTTFKDWACFLFKKHPIYGISLVLVILASPFILCNLLSGIFENYSLLGPGLIMLFPAMIITNFISGIVGIPFVFAYGILAVFHSMLKK